MTTQGQLFTPPPPKWTPTDRQPRRAPTGTSWADFCDWVAWLDDAYELNLPTCWLQHEGATHALSALWDAWLAVYSRLNKPGTSPPQETGRAAWHVQFLRPIIADLLAENSGLGRCVRNDKHSDYLPRANKPDRHHDALTELEQNAARDQGPFRPTEYDRVRDAIQENGPGELAGAYYHPPPK
jgi:hypothetical protein